MTANIHDLPALLFECLRQMDREATNRSYYQGVEYPTGLREYALHVNPNRNPNRTPRNVPYEEAMTNRLAELIEQSGLSVETYPRYPSGEEGDLLVHLSDGSSLWIEMKGAWVYNLHPTVNPNPNYRKHLTSPSEGLAKDFFKVQGASATYVGILLIGFETDGYRIWAGDIAALKQNANYGAHAWSEHTDEWSDNILQGSKVRVWFWWRRLAEAGSGDADALHEPIATSASASTAPNEEEKPSSNLSLEEMVARVRRRIIQNHERHGENWYWETYYVEFSADCGIQVAAPEDYGPPDRKNPTRKAFAQKIRRVIPMGKYNRKLGLRMVREITLAILQFHGVAPAQE